MTAKLLKEYFGSDIQKILSVSTLFLPVRGGSLNGFDAQGYSDCLVLNLPFLGQVTKHFEIGQTGVHLRKASPIDAIFAMLGALTE